MKQAVILMNLGTPAEPTPKAVRSFLKEFLSDRRVVEVPKLIWWCILHGFILPFRSLKTAKGYKVIWEEGGSPLRLITQRQTEKLQRLLSQHEMMEDITVAHAMSYSGPSLEDIVSMLEEKGCERFLILPLYPQYSATTTGSVYDQVAALFKRRRNIPEIQLIKQYYDFPPFIEALAQSVEKQWKTSGPSDRLLMSFHGIPQRNVDLGDPYFQQCKKTAELLAERLKLKEGQWAISFQSRLGRAIWLQPYTSAILEEWGKEQINHVDVICPAFSSDCLETLEEIKEENKHIFQSAGGGKFHLIPCLNDMDEHIEMMFELVRRYLPH